MGTKFACNPIYVVLYFHIFLYLYSRLWVGSGVIGYAPLPYSRVMSFTSAELAFQAEDTQLTVVPKQSLSPLDMCGWRSPALRALRRTELPLWFAILLKRQDRCSVVWPDWLSLPRIKSLTEFERQNSASFASLPWEWQLVSTILLKEASDDYEYDLNELRQHIQDLRELRLTKIRAGVLMANEGHLKMTGLGAMEINEIRPLLTKTMRTLQRIREDTSQ